MMIAEHDQRDGTGSTADRSRKESAWLPTKVQPRSARLNWSSFALR
jgi:hypothetical protein